MSFWNSKSGMEITGTADAAFATDFTLIPNGTLALAKVIKIEMVDKDDPMFGEQKYYHLTWKIISNDFIGKLVNQKIKCFTGKPESIDKALNMLKYLYTLCNYKPTHNNAPTARELEFLMNKTFGIKVREYATERSDGKGYSTGNYVGEVHPEKEFLCSVGTFMEVKNKNKDSLDSAFSRNPRQAPFIDSDIPFI